ncbi:MAG: UDP-N-acetylmuramate dehydrogenase [Anaerolineales bacterium]|nr:UDP-N-acetylmuramate dehydrogenase [Anaerolineales bacterium]
MADLRAALGDRVRLNEPLARYTSARLGGPAEYLAIASSAPALAALVRTARSLGFEPTLLGGGSNVLVSDAGVRGLVILNRARAVVVRDQADPPSIWAESGANLGALARQCAAGGLAGLEWAATVPGTVGGAVFGNAGAHGGDLAGNLVLAEILQREGQVERWALADLEYGYRTSRLKRLKAGGQPLIVLAAELKLGRGEPAALQARVDEFVNHRKRTQPPGASLGSMFKNPPGDFAGRLIEAAGLKGARAGQAQISSQHANFFVNQGQARAADVFALIHRAHAAVLDRFGVDLELEIELVGDWTGMC